MRLKLHAHAMKGAARNIGAKQMYDIADRLECVGRKSYVEAAASLLDELKSEYEEVMSFLSRADWIEIAKQEKVVTAEKIRAYPTCNPDSSANPNGQ